MDHSSWLRITDQADESVEIDITGIIGGSFWFDESNDSANTREKMRAELKALAELKAKKIIINIDSPGGDVSHGLSIHDLLAQHPAEKEVRIIGMTASIATVIAMAGNVRKMSDNALFLVHLASLMGFGNKNDLKMALSDLEAVDNRIKNIYLKRGVPEAKIDELINANNGNGKWIDAVEAKEFGFIDEVTEPLRAAASVDRNLFNKLKYPELPINYNMKDEDVKTLGEKIDGILNKLGELFTPKPAEPKPAEMTLDVAKETIKNLEATISANQEIINQAKTEAEKIKQEAELAKTEALAVKTEADKILNELRELKNSWVPEGRQSGNKVDGIDKVKEYIENANKTDKK